MSFTPSARAISPYRIPSISRITMHARCSGLSPFRRNRTRVSFSSRSTVSRVALRGSSTAIPSSNSARRARRRPDLFASVRARLTVIRYSHVVNDASKRNLPSPRWTFTKTSCATSSASARLPVIPTAMV